jgi:hypothetical protein
VKPVTVDEMIANLRGVINQKVWTGDEIRRRAEVLQACIALLQKVRP